MNLSVPKWIEIMVWLEKYKGQPLYVLFSKEDCCYAHVQKMVKALVANKFINTKINGRMQTWEFTKKGKVVLGACKVIIEHI